MFYQIFSRNNESRRPRSDEPFKLNSRAVHSTYLVFFGNFRNNFVLDIRKTPSKNHVFLVSVYLSLATCNIKQKRQQILFGHSAVLGHFLSVCLRSCSVLIVLWNGIFPIFHVVLLINCYEWTEETFYYSLPVSFETNINKVIDKNHIWFHVIWLVTKHLMW